MNENQYSVVCTIGLPTHQHILTDLYLFQGKTDCCKPTPMDKTTTNMSCLVKRNEKIYKENIELLTKIVHVVSNCTIINNKSTDLLANVYQIFQCSKFSFYRDPG